MFLYEAKLLSTTRRMQAMIPHHSIAILTSKRADLKDPEVNLFSKSLFNQEEEIETK